MTADRGDIYRYLGCRDSQPPAELRQMVEDCLAALEKAVAPRRVYRLYPLDEAVEGTVRFGGLSLESRDLSALLEGCGMVALLGVTLGPQADTLIRRSEKLEMSRAVVLDACASALAEAQAEDCQREAEAASGLRAVGRFSPGYGDLPLEEQGEPLILKGKVGIRLENVTFAYPDGKRKVIEHFTHDFEPGSLTAVLGETGSGKSTMVRLMLALLRPDGGNITLYDERQSLPASPLTRRNFVYVPQGNTLVSGTLRDNLLLGNPEATDAQMWKALHMAAADFVHELPQGLGTPCGEMGTGLSEGQAQRIAIARGLLRPGNIVLLDEPTSSLDSDTEQTLLERLSHTIQGKTLIIITHQMQTARLCDKIKKMATT